MTHKGNVTYPWMVLHKNELDYAKRDSRLETYEGVVLQRFIKFVWERNGFARIFFFAYT